MNLAAWNEISSSNGIEKWLIRARMRAFLGLADVYSRFETRISRCPEFVPVFTLITKLFQKNVLGLDSPLGLEGQKPS